MLALGWQAIESVPPDQAARCTRTVQVWGDTVAAARELGISLTD